MQHAHRRRTWVWGRRLRLVASTSGSVLVTALWATPVLADPPPEPAPPHVHDDEPYRFDSGFNVYVSPGGINVPYGGRDSIDDSDTYDPGFQWGTGFGYFARTDGPFAIHAGAFFEQAIVNQQTRVIGDDDLEHIFRAGVELEPGFVIGERVFVGLPLRGGYSANVHEVDEEIDANHGPHFGIGLGMDLAILYGFYVGTSLGTDLHFFRSVPDFDTYLFSWRARLGYRF